MGSEKRKLSEAKKGTNIWAILLSLPIGLAFSLFEDEALSAIGRLSDNMWQAVSIFIIFIAALFIHINLHELAHFAAGRLVGYFLISYRIGFLGWQRENGRMKFIIRKNNGYGGLCAMIPPEKPLPLLRQMLFYSAGTLTNGCIGLLFLASALLIPGLNSTTVLIFKIFGGIGIALFIVNLIPFSTGGLPTDGKILFSLLFKKSFSQIFIIHQAAVSQLSAGIRPRDIHLSFDVDIEIPDDLDIAIRQFAYWKAVDNGEYEEARKDADWFEVNIERFPDLRLSYLYNELCFAGCISGDLERAAAYYSKAGKILQKDKDVNGLRVKAYYAFYAEKDTDAAGKMAEEALSVADKYPLRGLGLMERDLIIRLQQTMAATN